MPNLVLAAEQTAIRFISSGGDVAFDPQGLANDAAHASAEWDRGSADKPRRYRWSAIARCQASGKTVGNVIQIWLATTGYTTGNVYDGNVTESNATVALDKVRSCHKIGQIRIHTTTAAEDEVESGTVEIDARAVKVIFWNESGATFSTTSADFEFHLEPVPDEIQD